MAYDKDSWQAKQGEEGNDRALDLIVRRLAERKSNIVVKRGPKNPGANGKLGDILFSRPDEAPLVGIEVKTPKAKYPDSVSLSRYEADKSRATWLMAMNEDPELGCWFVTMPVVRAYKVEKQGKRGANDIYYVSEPPIEHRVPLDRVLDEIQRIFGER